MNKKLAVGLTAVATYGVAHQMMLAGYAELPLWVTVVASAGAVGLIIVEWSRV